MCNNDNSGERSSLVKLLFENEVIIPIIQRDYAQGRLGKKNSVIRSTFFSDILKAYESKSELMLDFVYGNSPKDGVFYPLDGQQRLTTLWLVFWYFAQKSKKMDAYVNIDGDLIEKEEFDDFF